MAVYNGKRFLKEQIDSLLAQTRLPDVIVCCDDGSTDGSYSWLQQYVTQRGEQERFLLLKNDQNLGYIRNFYQALDLCDADILFLADQDDIWFPEKIEKMTDVFARKPDCALLSCAHTIVNTAGKTVKSLRYGQKNGSGQILSIPERSVVTAFRWPGMTMALRRDFYQEVRSTLSQISAPHDRVIALSAASQKRMYYTDIPLCAHRFHDNNAGGEEDRVGTYLTMERRTIELTTSINWLSAQIAATDPFSPIAYREMCGYRSYLQRRLAAVRSRSLLRAISSFTDFRYANPRGIIADIATILRNP